MDWTSIFVAVIMAVGAGLGSMYGIKKSNSLVEYRLNELTKEVKKHNEFGRKIPVIEEKLRVISDEKLKTINQRLKDLESKKQIIK